MYGKNFKDVPKETRDLNNKAYVLQSIKHLKNYYVLIPIKIKITILQIVILSILQNQKNQNLTSLYHVISLQLNLKNS